MVSLDTKYFLLRVDDTWTNVCVQHVLACVRHMATHAKDERVGGLVLEVHGTLCKSYKWCIVAHGSSVYDGSTAIG